jgi:hypothetical protein
VHHYIALDRVLTSQPLSQNQIIVAQVLVHLPTTRLQEAQDIELPHLIAVLELGQATLMMILSAGWLIWESTTMKMSTKDMDAHPQADPIRHARS